MSIDFQFDSPVRPDAPRFEFTRFPGAPAAQASGLQTWIDSMHGEVAVLDQQAVIAAVNAGWQRFAADNHLPPVESIGVNYLVVCDAVAGHDRHDAQAVANGIRGILRGDFFRYRRRYACHAPDQQRWYLVKAWRIVNVHGVRVVVAHEWGPTRRS